MEVDLSADYGWTQLEDDQLVDELQREVGHGHVLFGVPVRGVKRCGDDVLFELVTPSQVPTFKNAKYVEVHLTWCHKGPDVPPWPGTQFYASLDQWNSQFDQRDREDNVVAKQPGRRVLGMTMVGWLLLFLLLALMAIASQQ